MIIEIPNYKLPSWNKIYSSGHWRTRHKIAKEVHEFIKASTPNKMIKGIVDITIHQHYKHKRRHDSDNITHKLVIDSLCGRVIKDDDTRYVRDVTTRAIIGCDEDKLIITITNV